MTDGRELIRIDTASNNIVLPQRAGLAFNEDFTSDRHPNLFGNHNWYFYVMTRQEYQLFEARNRFWGCIAPSWTDGINGGWSKLPVVLRPRMAPGSCDDFVEFLYRMSDVNRNAIIVKQVEESVAGDLIASGCRRYRSDEAWNSHHKLDEQDFPEVVLDIGSMTDGAEESIYSDLSKQALRVKDRYVIEETPIGRHSKESRCDLIEVFLKWRMHFGRRFPTFVTYDFIGWNVTAIDRIFDERDHRLFVGRDTLTSETVGFFYMVKSTDAQLDMALSFCEFRENDLHRLLYRKVLERVASNGIKYVNMGGSEEESLYRFKKRIWRSIDIACTNLIFEGDRVGGRNAARGVRHH
jgi:hypothetical protein